MGLDQTKPSVLLIAGEKSGEENCFDFFSELVKKNPHYSYFGVGGDQLASVGLELLYHLKDFGAIGFVEVIGKLFFYVKAMKRILREVEERNCKVAILVDFQEFNYNLAKRLKKRGVEVIYFVAPQAWAWRQGRAKVLGKNIHTLFSIFPFEKKWFASRGVKRVFSVLHPSMKNWKPLLSQNQKLLEDKRQKDIFEKKEFKILLLPGSRKTEVMTLLPIFCEALKFLKKEFSLQVGIVKTESVSDELYRVIPEGLLEMEFYSKDLGEALLWTDFCVAASGTVTLNCALFEVPTVVCYKVPFLSAFIYASIVSYRGPISLPNMISQKIIFPELLQENASVGFIIKIFRYWLTDGPLYEKIKLELKNVRERLSGDNLSVSQYIEDVIVKTYAKNN